MEPLDSGFWEIRFIRKDFSRAKTSNERGRDRLQFSAFQFPYLRNGESKDLYVAGDRNGHKHKQSLSIGRPPEINDLG